MWVYLDDERKAPEGWVQCRWPEEVIKLLETGQVTDLSLDHDLGEDCSYSNPRTGYDVITWMEQQVATNPNFQPPRRMVVHSANPVAKQRMKAGLRQIYKMTCKHEHLNEEGYCRRCDKDCRGIG